MKEAVTYFLSFFIPLIFVLYKVERNNEAIETISVQNAMIFVQMENSTFIIKPYHESVIGLFLVH